MEVEYFTPMRVLALDSTTRAGSVAVLEKQRVLVERRGDETRTHGERLPGELTEALAAADMALSDVDLFAVAAGPGSFTGLRIGIAAMQGLAVVMRRPLIAVSALDALAECTSRGLAAGLLIGVWMDAQRHDVFAARYQVGEPLSDQGPNLIPLEPPRVDRPDVVLEAWRADGRWPAAIAGDGAVRYRALVEPRATIVAPPLLAAAVGRLAVARAHAGGVTGPAAVRPLYVRRPDAELARERDRHA
jgi:tRNA threonylcarbamoyladenosine biosynthesis protein TsaB